MSPFTVGQTYRRIQDIHERFGGGQRQGGISTPSGHPYVFLFTGEGGAAFGYQDEFRSDGTFWYTGKGQSGDMEMVRGNEAIRSHMNLGKALLLFEYVSKGSVRFIGEATYLGHHVEQRPDKDGNQRNAIIFELEVESNPAALKVALTAPTAVSERNLRLWSRPLKEVRALAMAAPAGQVSVAERRRIVHQRS